jgi:protein gp37
MSKIQWTDETWNPIVGCSRISEGCQNCYAESGANSARLQQFKQYQKVSDWNGQVEFVESQLVKPLKWKKPRKIFVCSMSDLFHENVSDEWICEIFAYMCIAKQHTFQILTKRPERMKKFLQSSMMKIGIANYIDEHFSDKFAHQDYYIPASNIWIGTTCENQKALAQRLPYLLETPAAVRFLSCEPLLEDIYLALDEFDSKPDWVIVGGESGTGARKCSLNWIRSIINQCSAADVPVFVKQLGQNAVDELGNKVKLKSRKGGDISEFPEGLKVREFPKS